MNFSDASKVATVVWAMKSADLPRALNRANIQRLFNGEPPYSEAQALENSIQTNVNFLEGTKMAHDARQQFNNAFLKTGSFFTVTLTEGDPLKRLSWGRTITKNINKPMKDSLEYVETKLSKFANVVLHGPGPVRWCDHHKWCPEAIGIEDLLIPSNTLKSFSNLNHFAIFREFTPGKLYKITHGDATDKGWRMSLVNEQLWAIKDENSSNGYGDFQYTPEKMAERYKANLGYYDSDAVPTIKCWDFFFQDEKTDKWNRRIILDMADAKSGNNEFLYKRDDYASSLSELMHVQFGDGANKAPFYYHSVRSLGFLLYAVCLLQNRLRSKFNDCVFEQMLWYFYVSSPEDRDRLQKIELNHMGIIPEGMRFVPAIERFQPRADLVNLSLSQNRQNMSENSSSFTQDTNDGSQKEMTATETMARVNAASTLVGAMLNMAYTYEKFEYVEICRRFCIKGSDDKDVKKFREKCIRDGVPEKMLDVEKWEIEPERVLGSGNKILQIAQADKLMAARPLYDQDSQRQILHIYTEVNCDDPQLAESLVPSKKSEVNDAIMEAQWASGTLMMGLPVAIKQGINHVDYVEALLVAMASVVQRIEQSGGVGSEVEIYGLQNIAAHIQQHVAIIAQNESEKERVKKYSDAMGNLMNKVKAFAQRLAEQQQAASAGAGVSPEAQAKIASSVILAQTQAKIKEASNVQKLTQKDQAFAADQKRKDIALMGEAKREDVRTRVDVAKDDALTAAEIQRKKREPKPKAAK